MKDEIKKNPSFLKVVLGYVDILLGLQWGDEGKGKIVDCLAQNYDIVARFQGGPNAGHTLWYKDKKIVLHNLPSGILHSDVKNFIGPGCVVNPVTFLKEIKEVAEILGLSKDEMKKRIYVSKHTFLIHPYHCYLDKAIEKSKGNSSVGTTGKGIGPCYSDIKERTAFCFGNFISNPDFFESNLYANNTMDLVYKLLFYQGKYGYEMPNPDVRDLEEGNFIDSLKELCEYMTFVDVFWLEDQIIADAKVLAEGAQGTMLDNNFGCYPMVTSSNTIAGAAPIGLGVPMKYFRKTIGVAKWYTTKVGSGEFPSEMDADIQNIMREAGGEVGATTGRPRRVGWLDIPQLRYALRINDVDELIITKVDINPLDSVEVVSSYVVDGKLTRDFPFDISEIEKTISHNMNISWKYTKGVQVIKTDLGFYLNYIKNQISDIDVKITHVSVGPGRNDMEEVDF